MAVIDLEKALILSKLVWGNPAHSVSITDTQIAYKDIDGERWIAFEASDSWRDLLTHIQLWPVKFQGGRAHAGFARAYRSVRDILWAWVEKSPYPVVWTGHSLGGALANLACADLGGRVVTTGAPRVWWGRPPLMNVQRYETLHDPVPMVPPFYRHAGHVTVIPDGNEGWRAHLPETYERALE